jgi:hypothetical protein
MFLPDPDSLDQIMHAVAMAGLTVLAVVFAIGGVLVYEAAKRELKRSNGTNSTTTR